jgi:hypothetical protein
MRSSRQSQNVDLASPHRQNEGTDDHHYTDGPGEGRREGCCTDRTYVREPDGRPPYTRFGVTEDAQSQIVPTLIHRSGNPVESTC